MQELLIALLEESGHQTCRNQQPSVLNYWKMPQRGMDFQSSILRSEAMLRGLRDFTEVYNLIGSAYDPGMEGVFRIWRRRILLSFVTDEGIYQTCPTLIVNQSLCRMSQS
ncbi:hypothetical protein Drorol1_Dr00022961 [Drosera rotundifolia]